MFYTSKGEALFMMQGRWANTPEISLISSTNRQERIIYPDRISVGYDSFEPLDCVVKFDDEKIAYGWNNESYPTNGRNQKYKLEIGTYKVTIRLSGQNFRQVTTQFDIVIAGDWQGTSVTLPD
jgi:hypothetical protein